MYERSENCKDPFVQTSLDTTSYVKCINHFVMKEEGKVPPLQNQSCCVHDWKPLARVLKELNTNCPVSLIST